MKISKSRLAAIIIGVFFLAMASMYASVYSPAIAEMYNVFVDDISALNFFISGSGLINLVVMLLCPTLEKKVGSKRLLIIGAFLIGLSGVVGLTSQTILVMNVAQCLNLCGYGITGTMALSVLMTILTTDKSRSFFNGFYQVIIAGSASVFAIVGGMLAVKSWSSALSATWGLCIVLGFVAAILLLVFLPNKLTTGAQEETQKQEEKTPTPWKQILVLFFGFLIIGLAYQYINLMMSVYVAENALGDELFAGTLQSLGTIGSAVLCFSFGFLYPKFKKKLILAPLLVFSVFILAMGLVPSRSLAIVGALLMGGAFGCSDVYFYTICPEIAPKHMTTAIAWVGLALNIPYMVFSYMYTALSSVFGTLTASLKCVAVFVILEFIIAAVALRRKE